MSRFQAQTTATLDEELSDLQERLGLRENQKADLLYEIAMLAAWVIRQAEAGRRIEARRGREVETLQNFVIERLSRKHAGALSGRIDLADTEVRRLAEILDQGFSPTPALREALSRLADPKRQPPRLRWQETKA